MSLNQNKKKVYPGYNSMIFEFFIVLFIGRVFSSFSDFTNLAADVELNLYLIDDIIGGGTELSLTKELEKLRTKLSQLSEALLQPKLLKRFCGNARSPNPLMNKLLNKYQYETCNPFAERIDYNLLDQSKFVNPIPTGFTASNLKDNSALAEEIENLIKDKENLIFKQHFLMLRGDQSLQYRKYIKERLKKYIIRRVDKYAASQKIKPLGLNGAYGGIFEDSIKLYINSGKPKTGN